jgi:hypothetical protein
MNDDNKAIHIEDDDARAASAPGVLRYVLGFSLLFAIIAMSAVWIIPAIWG